MKKVFKPAEKEEAIYFSDFTGKSFGEWSAPVDLKINFNYGSERDGASLTLHLDDEDTKPIIDLIKQKLSEDIKQQLAKKLETLDKDYEDSMQFRDWQACDNLTNNIWFLRELLDIKTEE
jgi:hypothetical protein